uniref:Integrase catalytic domain-containing protein n=1 Tax=Cyprinodon variegatus TaxID=28743 RepID=A0A3Q2FT90_CYPVA
MALLANMSSNCVITHAKSIFARHGIPHIVVSDNGPCFSSREWQEFTEHYDFKHVTSSPHYAQSNGKAEKGVHILKQLLKKAADSNSDPYLALLSYRSSPLQCGFSPAELLMNRKIRTTLPSYDSNEQSAKKSSKLEYKLRKQKVKQKSYYDRSTKILPPLSYKDPVRIEDDEGWNTKATILQEVAPRSFEVKTEDGQVLRRNRRSLLKTPLEPVVESSEVSKDSQSSIMTETPTTETPCDSLGNNLPVLRRSTRVLNIFLLIYKLLFFFFFFFSEILAAVRLLARLTADIYKQKCLLK